MLAAHSPRAPQDTKMRHMFSVYDVDGDGVISVDDLELITRMLTGSGLTYVVGWSACGGMHVVLMQVLILLCVFCVADATKCMLLTYYFPCLSTQPLRVLPTTCCTYPHITHTHMLYLPTCSPPTHTRDDQLHTAVSKAFKEAGVDIACGITYKVYCKVLRDVPLEMEVELPIAD